MFDERERASNGTIVSHLDVIYKVATNTKLTYHTC